MNIKLITHHGSSSLSVFREHLLATRIGALSIHACYVHYAAVYEGANDEEEEALKQLLALGDDRDIEQLGKHYRRYGGNCSFTLLCCSWNEKFVRRQYFSD